MDIQRGGGIHLRRAGYILRLIDSHRRQLRQAAGDGLHQLTGPLMGGGGHGHELIARLLHMGAEGLQLVRVRQQIRLVGHHDLGPLGQLRAILLQLSVDGIKVRYGVPALAAGDIHQMHQQTAAVNVPQEVVAQPGPLAGPLDDAGDIRHNEGHALIHIHHAQIGIEGGEVVVGDLGMGLADHAQKGALAHVGKAHQTHVRQQLQLQHHVVALAGKTRLGEAGYLPGGGGEVLVAPAAPAALAKNEGLAVGHILDDLAGLGIPDERASGDPDGETLAVLAALAAALAVYTGGCHIFALVAEVHKGGHIVIHLHNDAAAVAAVAAVRAAGGHVFLPVEGHGSVTAVAGPDGNAGFIDESICHNATSFI